MRKNLREPRSACSLSVLLALPDRYEDEINKRTGSENDFVVLKKVRERGVPRVAVDQGGFGE